VVSGRFGLFHGRLNKSFAHPTEPRQNDSFRAGIQAGMTPAGWGRQERFTVVPCFEFEICYLYFIRPSGQVWFLWFWFLVLLDRISDFRLRICYLNFIRHGGQVWSLFFVIWFFTFPSDFAFIPGIFFFFSLIYNNF
jgi:hypothetical protein